MLRDRFRILYLKEEVRRGSGDSHYLVAQTRALASCGHEQHVLTSRTDFAEEFAAMGVTVHYGPFDNRQKDPVTALRAIRRIMTVARNIRADLLHAHHRWPGFLGWIASRRLGLPIVSTDHTDFANHRLLSFRGEALFAVSEFNRDHLVREFGIPLEKIAVVGGFTALPSSPDPTAVDRLRAELALDPSEPCIVTVGQFHPVKNHELLLGAFARLVNRKPGAHLLVVGEGPRRAQLEELATRLRIAESVHWLGFRSDVTTVVGAADLFVMSSRTEGTPLAMVEAMALGVPVVSTAVGGVPTLLDDGACGALVPPQNPSALAAAIINLLTNTDRRTEFAAAARKRAYDLYNQDALAGRVEDVYRRVCAERPAPWRTGQYPPNPISNNRLR